MNRNRHHLVFSALQGRLVPVREGTRSRGKAKRTASRFALGAALAAAASAVAGAGALPAAPLPAGTLPKPLSVVLSPNDGALATVTGSKMTVNQILPRAILNWQQFNVAKDASVSFVQPSKSAVALNRIFDANPSVIQGRIDANGQIYMINRNGILFDRGAQINVGGLIASALDISDRTFLKGFATITDGSAAFAFDDDLLAFERSLVRVENGASINTPSGGQVFMFAKRVENAGRIETPQGQTVLAAGAKVYLAASEDPLLRGFLVEVDPYPGKEKAFEGAPAATAVNEKSVAGQGEILADRGNVTLIGRAVNQQGRISATTSVNANGSIYLLARESTSPQPQGDGRIRRVPTLTGTVTLGPGSVSEIVPVSGGDGSGASETSIDGQGFNPSQVKLFGGKILMESGSTIHAPGGKVDLVARESGDPENAGVLPRDSTRSRIVLAPGSRIDVSGVEEVELPMERNVVSAGLFGVELADSPVQRSGVLSRKTVKFDLRKGLPTIANVQGAVDAISRGIDERSSAGGTVDLSSDGSLVVREGSAIDVSGGSLRYRDGYVDNTMLISAGRAFDFSKASADRIYDSIATSRRFEAGYIEGKDAGTVSLFGRGMAVDGTLIGSTTIGPLQRSAAPAGGKLVVGNRAASGNQPDYVVSDVEFADGIGRVERDFDRFPLFISLGDRLDFARLSTQPLKSGGFGSVAIYANGTIAIPESVDLSLAPKTSIELTAHGIEMAGDIRAAGGAVTLSARTTVEHGIDGTASISVAPKARVDLSGMWVNDVLEPSARGPLSIRGGSFSATALGAVSLGKASAIDVSGGAWLKGTPQKQSRSNGDAGSISVRANSVAANPDGSIAAPEENPLRLEGELLGYALSEAKGGKLTLGISKVVIGAPADDDALGLAADIFARGGFADYAILAPNGIEVAPGAKIALRRFSWLLDGREWTRPSGALREIAEPTLLSADLRQAAGLSLTADNPFVGTIEVGRNASIDADIGAAVKLVAGRQLTLDGSINAPAGTIDLAIDSRAGKPQRDFDGGAISANDPAGFLPDQSVWLKPGASLNVAGAAKVQVDANGNRQGELFNGGQISLRALKGHVVAEAGSRMDAHGGSMEIDLRQAEANGAVRSVPVSLYSDGGTIAISAREGAFIDAALDLRLGGGSARGGRFELSLDRSVDAQAVFNAQVLPGKLPYPDIDRRIVLTDDAAGVPWNYRPGFGIPFSLFGTAPVSAARLRASGADQIALRSDSQIVFSGDVALSAPRAITLDAPVVAVAAEPLFFIPGSAGGGKASIAAPNVSFGNRNPLAAYQNQGREASGGTGRLSVLADLLDLTGNVTLQGIGHASFTGRSDIRLSGVVGTQFSDLEAVGSLKGAGELSFTAGQLYPTTLTRYSLSSVAWPDPKPSPSDSTTSAADTNENPADSEGSLIRFARFGSPGALPLSAGARLEVTADRIEQGGVLRAPMGSITLNAGDSLDLLAGSETSVTAKGLTIPFGRTENGLNWVYDIATGRPIPIDTPPEKRILLDSESIRMAQGASVDLRGGGDLYGYEFIAGLGGSKDVLANFGTFAVIPGYQPAFAPYDPQYSAGYGALKPGDQVSLSAGAGLAAGTYTLLPAHYALLPGAFAVTPVSGYRDLLPGRGQVRNDGAAILSGRMSVAGLEQRDARAQGFLVEPQATIRKRSEFRDEYANTFFARDAERNDFVPPRLARDGGRLQLDAQISRDLLGAILMSAAGDAKDALGGQFDVNSNDIFVSETRDAIGGLMVLKPSMLTGLGAQSILLGGLRGKSVDGVQAIEVGANDVVVASSTSPLRAGEVLLVAKDRVIVGARSVIEATPAGASSAATVDRPASSYSVAGGSPVLRVARGDQADVSRIGATADGGTIVIGDHARLRGDSVLIDATGDISVRPTAKFDASAIGLAAGRIGFGTPSANAEGVVVSQPLLTQFQSATELAFKSYSDITFFGDVSLGRAGLASLTLDSPALIGSDGGKSTITAGRVTLRNSSGATSRAGAQKGGSELQVAAVGRAGGTNSGTLELGEGDIAFSGFARTTLAAGHALSMAGEGSASFSGELSIEAPTVGGQTGSTHRIAAGGTVDISRGGKTGSVPAEGFAAQLEISGTSIAQRGTIDLPAGILSLQASGDAGGGVTLGSGSVTRTAGYTKIFRAGERDETAVHVDAGSITLVAGSADPAEPAGGGRDVTIESGARVDVSAVAEGGNAGTLALIAPAGRVAISGEIAGGATRGADGGKLQVDAGTINGLSTIVARAGTGQFSGGFDLRARSGDLNLGAGDTIHAASVNLSADKGSIEIGGQIDASGVKGGRIRVFADGDLSLLGTAGAKRGGRLAANAVGAGNDGGSIVLGSTAGEVELQAGSTIRLSGGAKGRGGSLIVRAAQTESLDEVRISRLESTITGARETVIEAVRVYEGVESIAEGSSFGSVLGTQTVQEDSDAFMANRDAIGARLGAAEFVLRPGVEVRAGGDLRLDSVWNLAALRPGGQSGYLSLRAAGNLHLSNTLNDGFASEVRSAQDPNGSGILVPTPLLDDTSWSYRLVGGADLAAADPLRLKQASAAAEGGDVVLGAQTMVRTGTGSIEIAAARDVRFESNFAGVGESAVVLTAGRPAAPLSEFTDHLLLDLDFDGVFETSLANYARAGGSVDIAAQRDVIGAATPQLPSSWLWRLGATERDPNTGEYRDGNQPTWFPRADMFRHNVGALAGGDVTVRAGRDLRDLSAMLPTIGRMNSLKPDPGKLVVEGGGDLRIDAGRDIAGGQFLVARGDARIRAGGSIGEGGAWDGNTPGMSPVLLLGDAKAAVTGRGDVSIENVIDPLVLAPNLELSGNFGYLGGGSSLFSYTTASALSVTSLTGNLELRNEPARLDLLSQSALFDPLDPAGPMSEILRVSPHPGTLTARALSGDLSLPKGLRLFPAARGQFELLADGSISAGGQIQMPDYDPTLLPNPALPGPAISSIDDLNLIYFDTSMVAREHADTPLHSGEREPVRLIAETGDIVAVGELTYAGVFAKPARIVAGRDIRNLHLQAQNLAETDETAVIAGRDIAFDELRDPTGKLAQNLRGIEVAGPGRLVVSAGRDIALGNANGIVTRGNLGNPALPDAGASIALTVGARPTLDTKAFATRWLDPAKPANYLTQLAEFLKTETGAAGLGATQASAAFAALPNADQVRFARSVLRLEFAKAYLQPVGAPGVKKSYRDQWLKFVASEGGDPNAPSAQLLDSFATTVLWAELKGTGRDALPDGATPGVYTRGYDALGLLGYAAPFSHNGNLSLFLSQIKTQRGGDIDILAPGGLVNGGATNLPANFAKGSGDLGIITERGGSIRALVKSDFLVNQSRVFTLGGGDILIWSSKGNIDAGRGSRTTISAPPPVIRFVDGQFVVEYPGAAQGSGIGVLLTRPGTIPGDVDLIAPVGEVNAGDAGIRSSGRISIAAQRVIGADVIQAGGGISGVPALAPPAPVPPPPPSSADKGAGSGDEAARALAGSSEKQKSRTSVLTVEVLGIGGEEDEEERKRRRQQAQ